MNTTIQSIANYQHKAALFAALLGQNKKYALSLYNALHGSNYTNEEDLEFTTLESVVYMKMKNDVSILVDGTLSLYEHQSTYNPNMPLRGFIYHADLYRQQIKDNEQIYSKHLLKIPTPEFYVFYNGPLADMPEERKELHLSDAFTMPTTPGKFEWTATMLNINYGYNKELMSKCPILKEYAIFVDKVRHYRCEMSLTVAVDRAIDDCIEENVLKEFLSKYRREAKNMVLTEFDENKYLAMMRKEEWEDGHAAGLREGQVKLFTSMLCDLGEIPDGIIERAETLDTSTLKEWNRLACRAGSMDEFLNNIQ